MWIIHSNQLKILLCIFTTVFRTNCYDAVSYNNDFWGHFMGTNTGNWYEFHSRYCPGSHMLYYLDHICTIQSDWNTREYFYLQGCVHPCLW